MKKENREKNRERERELQEERAGFRGGEILENTFFDKPKTEE